MSPRTRAKSLPLVGAFLPAALVVHGQDSHDEVLKKVRSEAGRTVFDRWLAPLGDIGVRRNIAQGIGNTDHLRFRAVGVPGFNPVQDYVDYDVRTHHTNMDTPERVRVDDLKQNAIVLAWFIYQAASMDQPPARVSTA
jgi:hypothetical protein